MRGCGLACGLLVLAATQAGCYKALFTERDARTQFDDYERMRGTAAPVTEPDVFGRPQPALRERLLR